MLSGNSSASNSRYAPVADGESSETTASLLEKSGNAPRPGSGPAPEPQSSRALVVASVSFYLIAALVVRVLFVRLGGA